MKCASGLLNSGLPTRPLPEPAGAGGVLKGELNGLLVNLAMQAAGEPLEGPADSWPTFSPLGRHGQGLSFCFNLKMSDFIHYLKFEPEIGPSILSFK